MSKTINFYTDSKRIQEYLKSLEFVLDDVKYENINDKFYLEMKSSGFFFFFNILNEFNDNFSILGTTTYLSQEYYNLSFSCNKKLENLDLDELLAKLYTYKCNQIEFRKILSLINKKRFALWLEKIIQKLKKMLKLLNDNIKLRIQNKREFFRKIYCFFFKNLDDTHTKIIFN